MAMGLGPIPGYGGDGGTMVFALAIACGPQEVDLPGSSAEGSPSSGDVTWHGDVAPIVVAHCATCHNADGIAPKLPYDTYAGAAAVHRLIADRAESRQMPPFRAADLPECTPVHPFSWDPRLSDAQIATLQAWSDAGAPEGDPTTAALIVPLPVPVLDDWTLELSPSEPFQPPLGDSHVCFVLPLGLDHDTWIDATEVLPGDPAVVHHVQVRLDPEGDLADLANEDGWYDCYGAINGIDLGGFLPGAAPAILPADTGVYAPVGSVVIAQVHYHAYNQDPHPDTTRVRLRTRDERPAREPKFQRVGNDLAPTSFGGLEPGDTGDLQFRIPAGESEHVERFSFLVTDPATYAVYLLANHMHAVGVRARLWVEHAEPVGAEPTEECLLATDPWDVEWQSYYHYDADNFDAPLIRPGDRIWLECTYDNSTDNPQLMDQLEVEGVEAPTDVVYGNTALDEMCAAVLGMVDVTGVAGWPGETPSTTDTGEPTQPTPTDEPTEPTDTTDEPPEPPEETDDPGEPVPATDGGSIVLTEVVDHALEGAIHYVEITNTGTEAIALEGFALERFANGAETPSSVPLEGTMAAGERRIYAATGAENEFAALYDLPAIYDAAISGNGDDAYRIVAPDGSVSDVYGEIGVDGSGTAWEYTDAVASRLEPIVAGRTTWWSGDWMVRDGTWSASPLAAASPIGGAEEIRDLQTGLIPVGEGVNLDQVIVTAVGSDGVWVQGRGDREWSGIFVYLGVSWVLTWGDVSIGDILSVRGVHAEWHGQTEVDVAGALAPLLEVTGHDVAPTPEILSVTSLAGDPEPWEGVLIAVGNVEVSTTDLTTFTVIDGSDSVTVGGGILDLAPLPEVGVSYGLIVGVWTEFDGAYALWPRDGSDLTP